MYQLTVLYNSPADPAAFDKHYDEVHTPLAAALPGLQRFTVQRPGPDPEGNPSPYHLVATLEWADEAASQNSLGSPEGQAAVADLANFAQAGMTMVSGDTVQPL